MAWIYLVLAGVLEIVWAFYMKKSAGFTLLAPSAITIVTMIASFALLSISMRTLPLGTAYTIWTGIGAVGAFAVGVVAWQLNGVFLNLCGSLAVRHDAAIGGYANENEMVARPGGKSSGCCAHR